MNRKIVSSIAGATLALGLLAGCAGTSGSVPSQQFIPVSSSVPVDPDEVLVEGINEFFLQLSDELDAFSDSMFDY